MIIDNAGTYTLRYTATDDCGKTTTVDRELVVAESPHIYGVTRSDTSRESTFNRTNDSELFSDPVPAVGNGNGSSPFDNLMPWSGMKIVNDAQAGELVSIPKYWYRMENNGTSFSIQISNVEREGFFTSPAHADRGDGVGERDVVYVGRYCCDENTYKSLQNSLPKSNTTINDFRTNIHALGDDIWQFDFAMYWTIAMLYLVEYADFNSQFRIGYGCGNNNSFDRTGATDAMQYHTGTNATSRTEYGQVQYRYIEGLWSNAYYFLDGIRIDGSNFYLFNNPSEYNNVEGGIIISSNARISGVIRSLLNDANAIPYSFLPYGNNPNYNIDEYVCDYYYHINNSVTFILGGSYTQTLQAGMFHFIENSGAATSKVGSRLMKLPSA